MIRKRLILSAVLLAGGAALCIAAGAQPAKPKFTLFIYESPEQFALRGDTTPKGQAYWGSFAAYGKALTEAGVLRGGSPLLPETESRVVSTKDGKVKVTNGPTSTAGGLQLGGYFLIEVDSMEAAVEWAAKAPVAGPGVVEVRPVLRLPGE